MKRLCMILLLVMVWVPWTGEANGPRHHGQKILKKARKRAKAARNRKRPTSLKVHQDGAMGFESPFDKQPSFFNQKCYERGARESSDVVLSTMNMTHWDDPLRIRNLSGDRVGGCTLTVFGYRSFLYGQLQANALSMVNLRMKTDSASSLREARIRLLVDKRIKQELETLVKVPLVEMSQVSQRSKSKDLHFKNSLDQVLMNHGEVRDDSPFAKPGRE